jgi:hypothetical protein
MKSEINRTEIQSVVLTNATEVLMELEALHKELDEVQKPIVSKLQSILDQIENHNFGSLDGNKAVASTIQDLLYRLSARALCPKHGCKEPMRFECAPAGGAKFGTFRCVHRVDGKFTSHFSSTKIPKMKIAKEKR